MDNLCYERRVIGSVETLARVLRVTVPQLRRISENASKMYRPGPTFEKSDGGLRETWDALPQLKKAQGRIKTLILELVSYPNYLQGGLKQRDYLKNATIHSRSRILVNEDVENFFPSVTQEAVFDVWRNFFHFPEAVAQCLTKLTTRMGKLPQGARTSTHLANLVLWRSEASLVNRFHQRGMAYSRLVDDISVSSRAAVTDTSKQFIVGEIMKMLNRHGYRAKRSKHAIMTCGRAMTVNNLNVQRSPSLPKDERRRIRAEVHGYEGMVGNDLGRSNSAPSYDSVAGRVALLKRFHPTAGGLLQRRLEAAKDRAKK